MSLFRICFCFMVIGLVCMASARAQDSQYYDEPPSLTNLAPPLAIRSQP